MSDYVFKFDIQGKDPKVLEIIIWAVIIFVGTNLIFMALVGVFGVNANTSTDNEKDKEFKLLKNKGITPTNLMISNFTGAVVFAPIAEELTFRFFLLKVILIEKLKVPFAISNIIQAVLFGAIHITNTVSGDQSSAYSNLQAISAMISGLLSGIAYKQTNSIFTPYLAHVLNNLIATSAEYWSYKKYYNTHQMSTLNISKMKHRYKHYNKYN